MKADVEIGEAIKSKGEAVTLEATFEELQRRMAIEAADNVKDENFETSRVPVDSLRFTQWSCSRRFRCGRPVSEAVEKFVRGAEPSELPWCQPSVARLLGDLCP